MAGLDRTEVEQLHMALIDTEQDGERASIHLELGRLAWADGRMELAVRHLKEALVLDFHLEQARTLLQELGESTIATIPGARKRRNAFRNMVRRLRRRG